VLMTVSDTHGVTLSQSDASMSERFSVEPQSTLAGEIVIPGDKSVSHRSVLLGGIAQGVTEVNGFLESEDCLATMAAMQAMGVKIERPAAGRVIVHGVGLYGLHPPRHALDMGNAGTAMRLTMGLLAGQRFAATLTGDASLSKRPMERAAAPLRLMGAMINTQAGKPPVSVSGNPSLSAIDYDLSVPSAQVKSAILIAGLYADGLTCVREHAITRDHTERMLKAFGVEVTSRMGSYAAVRGVAKLMATSIEVPGDISSAAFFLVGASLAADPWVLIRQVGMNPTRIGVIEILRLMGAKLEILNERVVGAEPVADIRVTRAELTGIDVPAHLVPLAIDEFPAIFVAAACANGVTRVTQAAELKVKESDRIGVMAAGLTQLGIDCEVLADGLVIRGQGATRHPFRGGSIDSHGDHRIAMAFAMASLRAQGPIEIQDTANVATSFPQFSSCAKRLGLKLEVGQ
jgi:3-phosphoshikimate 1-carboxyvinyltransferase